MEQLKKWARNLKTTNNIAVVLAGNAGALAIVRNLGKKGVPVIALGKGGIVRKSKYCKSIKATSKEEITDVLLNLPVIISKKLVLFTDVDEYMDIIYDNWEKFKNSYYAPVGDLKAYKSLTDKNLLPNTVEGLGISVPKTYVGKEQNGIREFPVFTKPINKYRFLKHYNVKGFKCNNQNEVNDILNKMKEIGTEGISQQIIEGDVQNLFSITLYRNSLGKTIVGYVGYKVRQHPMDFGTVTSFRTVENSELLELSKKLLEKSGYIGIANIEYKYCPKTNRYYIIEVNGRFPLATAVSNRLNNNFSYEIYLDLLQPSKTENIYDVQKKPVMWISFFKDFALMCLTKRNIFKEFYYIIRHTNIQMSTWDFFDPLPSIYSTFNLIKKMLKMN